MSAVIGSILRFCGGSTFFLVVNIKDRLGFSNVSVVFGLSALSVDRAVVVVVVSARMRALSLEKSAAVDVLSSSLSVGTVRSGCSNTS